MYFIECHNVFTFSCYSPHPWEGESKVINFAFRRQHSHFSWSISDIIAKMQAIETWKISSWPEYSPIVQTAHFKILKPAKLLPCSFNWKHAPTHIEDFLPLSFIGRTPRGLWAPQRAMQIWQRLSAQPLFPLKRVLFSSLLYNSTLALKSGLVLVLFPLWVILFFSEILAK